MKMSERGLRSAVAIAVSVIAVVAVTVIVVGPYAGIIAGLVVLPVALHSIGKHGGGGKPQLDLKPIKSPHPAKKGIALTAANGSSHIIGRRARSVHCGNMLPFMSVQGQSHASPRGCMTALAPKAEVHPQSCYVAEVPESVTSAITGQSLARTPQTLNGDPDLVHHRAIISSARWWRPWGMTSRRRRRETSRFRRFPA